MCKEYNEVMADENIEMLKNIIKEFNICLEEIRREIQSKTVESPLWLFTEIEFNSNNELNLKFQPNSIQKKKSRLQKQ